MKSDNKNNFRERVFQIVLVVLGATIALASSQITLYWQKADENAKLSNFIIGTLQNDLVSLKAEITAAQEDLNNPPAKKLHPSSVSWQHNSSVLESISTQIGALDVSIVQEFNNYVNMHYQSKGFREALYSALLKNNYEIDKVKVEVEAYIKALELQMKVCERLIKLIKN
jgi:hypothetical protein